jgi:hypothetical protein
LERNTTDSTLRYSAALQDRNQMPQVTRAAIDGCHPGTFAAFARLLEVVEGARGLAQLVAQRTQETGVRIALGSQPGDIARVVAAQGAIPVLAGLMLGMAAAISLGRYLGSVLCGVGHTTP